jgi:hypothetical protein
MSDEDQFEAEELERVAAWRLRRVDEDPADAKSAAAAGQLERLADDVRALRGSPLFQEYGAICNWLGEVEDRLRSLAGGRCGVSARADRSGEADIRDGMND